MLSWIKKLFGSGEGAGNDLGMTQIDLRSNREVQLQQQGLSPLQDEKDEEAAHELVLASHRKDRDTVKQLGTRLNSEGGLDRMKQIYYRAEHIGGDGRWIEMIWDGIGDWMG